MTNEFKEQLLKCNLQSNSLHCKDCGKEINKIFALFENYNCDCGGELSSDSNITVTNLLKEFETFGSELQSSLLKMLKLKNKSCVGPGDIKAYENLCVDVLPNIRGTLIINAVKWF